MKSDRIKNRPKEERPRERLQAEGAEKLTEVELLAMSHVNGVKSALDSP